MANRLLEIETRLSEIKEKLNDEGIDLDALKTETEDLIEERKQLIEGRDARREVLRNVLKGEGILMTEQMKQEEKKKYGVDTAEYRTAWLKNLMGKELSVEERTAVVASAAIPTLTADKIVGVMENTPLIGAVDVSYIPGNVTFPAESAVEDASWVAMGSASADSTATLSPVNLGAHKLIKTVEVAADVQAMSISAFESWLVSRLANKISKAVDASILKGSGSGQATGLSSLTANGTYAKTGMTFKNLMSIIAELPTEYANNAAFVMTRATFFGEVLGLETAAGDRVVVTDPQAPAKFNILGFPVIVDDNCTADTVYFGDLKSYKFNFSKAPTVELDNSVGFRTGSTVYRGMALADGKLADSKAIVKFTKASA